MKYNLMATVASAALLLGTVVASAQGTARQQGGEPQGAQHQNQGAQHQNQGARQEPRGPRGPERNQAQGQRQPGAQHELSTTGQGSGDREQGQRNDDHQQGQRSGDREPGQRSGNREQRRGAQEQGRQQSQERQRDRTTGQGQTREQGDRGRDQEHERVNGQDRREQGQREGAPREQGQEHRETTGQGARGAGGVTLTSEQRTRVRRSVLEIRDAPRMTHVDFPVRIGVDVPSSVHLVTVPDVLVEIHPEWRGFMYFILEDEVVIVDARSHEIVAVLDV